MAPDDFDENGSLNASGSSAHSKVLNTFHCGTTLCCFFFFVIAMQFIRERDANIISLARHNKSNNSDGNNKSRALLLYILTMLFRRSE